MRTRHPVGAERLAIDQLQQQKVGVAGLFTAKMKFECQLAVNEAGVKAAAMNRTMQSFKERPSSLLKNGIGSGRGIVQTTRKRPVNGELAPILRRNLDDPATVVSGNLTQGPWNG